jgi:hypothetical protein
MELPGCFLGQSPFVHYSIYGVASSLSNLALRQPIATLTTCGVLVTESEKFWGDIQRISVEG